MDDLQRLATWPLATLFVMGAFMTAITATPTFAITVDERAQAVADALAGTADGRIEDYATEAECNDKAFLQALDGLVFTCESCGWWCRDEDRSTAADLHCDECVPNEG